MNRRHWLVILVGGLILVGSLVPVPADSPRQLAGLDKLVHVVDYAVLAGVVAYALDAEDSRTVSLVFVAVVAFGAGVEIAQGLVSERSCSRFDVLANAVGAALVLGYRALARR